MKAFLPAMALAVAFSIGSVAAFAADSAAKPAAAPPAAASAEPLLKKYACIACHATATKLVGPSYKDVATKYRGKSDAAELLATKVKKGGVGVWGQIPMTPNPTVPDADLNTMIAWILALK